MIRPLSLCVLCFLSPAPLLAADAPRAADPRLVVERFAAGPDVVHPVGIDFDHRGRLLVIESHTHFAPRDYKGPKHDRILALEDTDGDGKADRFTPFFEGTRATMDIAVHPHTGDVYLATRNEVLRLRDTKGTGKADARERLVFLDTKGDYPHNGLSGLCFDSRGGLLFGMGENLGASYTLKGADGTTLRGGGEGGNVFRCSADGKGLRRFATGFWNPFGVCRDVRGRLFAVDNDPDSMPPCRLLHLAEGADFGYQFRYGRSGRHPFQCWDGQLPGTLPMVSGTGESPCEVLPYESDGLPREYLGDLLVTAWADHRVERYALREKGASWAAERRPFVQGGADFRPVGLAVAPDGSIFVSDWVRRDYQLHGQGAIWHVKPRKPVKADRPKDPRRALFSLHRPLREDAARRLAGTEAGRDFLREHVSNAEPRVRAACLTALIDDRRLDLRAVAEKESDAGLRALAVRGMIARGEDARPSLQAKQPAAVRLEAVAALSAGEDAPRLLALLTDADPYLRHAAIHRLTTNAAALARLERERLTDARQRCGLLLALRGSGHKDAPKRIPDFLADADEEVRFLAVKWVADERLSPHRERIARAMKERTLSVRLCSALATALARLDGREVDEARMADYFLDRLLDESASRDLRRRALQLVPARHPKLTLDVLTKALTADDVDLQREAVQALAEHPAKKRAEILLGVARNDRVDEGVRAQALVALAEESGERTDEMISFTEGKNRLLRDEALRALVGVRPTAAAQTRLKELARKEPATADLVARVLGQPFHRGRPMVGDTEAWLKRLEGPADESAGRRVFFHPKLPACIRCHRVDGRGHDVGPDLSTIGRRERRFILESILRPSAEVAPHFQAWSVVTAGGRIRTGQLTHTNLDEYTYVDEKGKPFKVNTRDVVETKALTTSLMPDGLADQLTDQEMRDLLAFLASRR